MGEDSAKMYEWFDRVGFTVDHAAFRSEFADVAFHDFVSWANARDWNTLIRGEWDVCAFEVFSNEVMRLSAVAYSARTSMT
jgi:hypothetical protein